MEFLISFLSPAREFLDWRALLDVGLLAAAALFLYRTLRTTGTWKMVLGVLTATAVYAAASVLDLRGVEWIFSNVSQVALIAVLVVFQPEIRRVLERVTPFWVRRQNVRVAKVLPQLLDDALFALATRRWGALMVIPGRDPLRQWLTQGVPSDARPSLPLILSVFDPDSPGHDGGMLFEGDRIARFGVRLPLSQSDRLPAEYGTRHHAALGLSEVSDALVLVVSEERGTVSSFHNGRMQPLREKGEAASRLLDHWRGVDSAPRQRTRPRGRWVAEVALSLLAAALFWSTVVLDRTETREAFFTVPIEYTPAPAGLVLTGEPPAQARLHLAGPLSTLTNLDLASLRVEVDLSRLGPGEQPVVLTDQSVRLPRKLRLLEIQPPWLEVELRAVREHRVGVQAQLVGQLPQGLQISSVRTNPETVLVLSPDGTDPAPPQTVMTTPIYLQGLRENTTVFGKIVAPPGIQPADRRWPDVEVKINVAPAPSSAAPAP